MISWPLDKTKLYRIRRIGPSRDGVITKGEIYCAQWMKTFTNAVGDSKYNWVITATDNPNKRSTASLSKYSNFWQILEACRHHPEDEDTTPINEEQAMTRNTELKSIEQGCIINGLGAKKFVDDELIEMLVNENAKYEALRDKLGENSKYFQSKAKTIVKNIAALQTELDARA